MRTILWLVGEPGIGKTTLARRLLPADRKLHPSPKWTVGAEMVAAGHYTGGMFDGADTVPYSGAKAALEFWAARLNKTPLTLLDGDRFSNAGAVEFFASLPTDSRLCCVHLTGKPGLAGWRRAARGSDQNTIWLKGRLTKAENFARTFNDRLTLDAEATPEELEQAVRRFLIEKPNRKDTQ